jgi:hypothetical protein
MGRARQIGKAAAKASVSTPTVPKWVPDCPYAIPTGKKFLVAKFSLRERKPVEIIATCERLDDGKQKAVHFYDHAHYAMVYNEEKKPVACYYIGRLIGL